MLVSVLIPCYRSEKTIENVVTEIKEVFAQQNKYRYQIVLVNDGSPDNTFEVIKKLCAGDRNIVGVNLTKNHGQVYAKMAAVKHCNGDIGVFMDDDGQHPAKSIIDLVEKVNEGYDVVYAKFEHKKTSPFRKLTSSIHNKLSEINGTKPKGIAVSSFEALSCAALNALKKYDSPFPSIGGYLNTITDKVANVDVVHRARSEGRSGYNFRKRFSLWLMSFTNFSLVPLRASSYVGIFAAVAGFILGIIMVIRKLVNPNIMVGYTSTITVVLIFGGIIMLGIGLLGEYIGRTYMVVSGKPQFSVKEAININNKNNFNINDSFINDSFNMKG